MSGWYVFHVQTGNEEDACRYVNNYYNGDGLVAFIPKTQLIYKNSKQIRKELKIMFPSYIFFEMKKDIKDLVCLTTKIVRNSEKIYKLLGRDNIEYAAIDEKEKDFISNLCDDRYIVKESLGFIEGDKICVISGPLKGIESRIKRIDRHKRRAEVELDFMGSIRRAFLPIDIIMKL